MRRLFLYFDVNMTVLMSDNSQGQSVELTVNATQLKKIIAGQCWGTCEETESARTWKLAHDLLSRETPDPSLISYK